MITGKIRSLLPITVLMLAISSAIPTFATDYAHVAWRRLLAACTPVQDAIKPPTATKPLATAPPARATTPSIFQATSRSAPTCRPLAPK